MEITAELRGFDKALVLFDDKKVVKAARLAVNEGVTTGRKVARQEIRKKWNIKAARLNKEMRRIKRARNSDLTAIIETKGRPISLVHFGARWVRGRITTTGTKSTISKRSRRSGGVFVQIRRGQRTRLPHAFIASVRAGRTGQHIGVFERVGSKRLPVMSRATVTSATMFNQERVMQPTLKAIDERMNQRFRHHLDRLLR